MANPVILSATGSHGTFSDTTSTVSNSSRSTASQSVIGSRTVSIADTMVQNPAEVALVEEVLQPDESAGYMQKLRGFLPDLSNFLPQIRDRLSRFTASSEAVATPVFKPTKVTVYHNPSLSERTVSVVAKVAKVLTAPVRFLVWRPLKSIYTTVCTAKTFLFHHDRYAAARQTELDNEQQNTRDHARYMSERCVNTAARMNVIEENLKAKVESRMPYVRALSEMAPILEQRRQALEANQSRPDDVEKFREYGVVPNGNNHQFVEAMAEYNDKIAEFKAVQAQYDAAVAKASRKGKQPPAMPAILAEKPEAYRFRCRDKAIARAFRGTNDKPLRAHKAVLTERLEELQARRREMSSNSSLRCQPITSTDQLDLIKAQISFLELAVNEDRRKLKNPTPGAQALQERVDCHTRIIEFKQCLVEIFEIEQELITLDRELLLIQSSRAIDVQEWKEGVIDPNTGAVEQGGRDRLSLDAIKVDDANIKTDSNGNVTHLAYIVERPLINPVHEEREDRDARNKGFVWRKAGMDDHPVASYEAVKDHNGDVVGSRPAEVKGQHWFVRNEPVVDVEGYDKRHLAVHIRDTEV